MKTEAQNRRVHERWPSHLQESTGRLCTATDKRGWKAICTAKRKHRQADGQGVEKVRGGAVRGSERRACHSL